MSSSSCEWACQLTVRDHAAARSQARRLSRLVLRGRAPPVSLGLALAGIEPDHLSVARLVHCVGEDEALPDHPSSISDLLDLGVEPQVGIAALERPLPEGLDLLVEPLADARDLGLGDPQPERLDHLVDLARRDAGDIGLLHDGDERLLGAAARLEEAREVAPPAQRGDGELELAERAEPVYPPHSAIRKVASHGVVAYGGLHIILGMRWAGARVRIVEVGELWHVYHGNELIRALVPDRSRRYQTLGKRPGRKAVTAKTR